MKQQNIKKESKHFCTNTYLPVCLTMISFFLKCVSSWFAAAANGKLENDFYISVAKEGRRS
jgi:hypothetical protein